MCSENVYFNNYFPPSRETINSSYFDITLVCLAKMMPQLLIWPRHDYRNDALNLHNPSRDHKALERQSKEYQPHNLMEIFCLDALMHAGRYKTFTTTTKNQPEWRATSYERES